MSTSPITPTKLAIIFAGEEFVGQDTAHPKIKVRTETGFVEIAVRVRAMPARHLARVAQLATKEAELVEFVCTVAATATASTEISGWEPVPAGWADNLDDDSHTLLYEAAKRLNFSRAAILVKRQIAAKQYSGELASEALEQLMPMVMGLVEPMLKEITRSVGSSSGRLPAEALPSPKS